MTRLTSAPPTRESFNPNEIPRTDIGVVAYTGRW